MLKAVFKGWLAAHVLMIIAMLWAFPFWWTLVFVYYPGAMFLDNGVSSAIPWLSILVGAGFLGLGGYVAAANTPRFKVTCGLCLSVVMVAYTIPLNLMGVPLEPTEILDMYITVLCMILFPPIGAFVARKWRRSDEPPRPLRNTHVMLAWALFPIGVFLPLTTWMLWKCWMQGSRVADDPTAAYELLPSMAWAVGAGLVLTADAIILFVKRRGWKKGLVLNWYVYFVAITACFYCFGFMARYRENTFVMHISDSFASDVDSAFVFPDPGNPATLYIQASMLIPDEERTEQASPFSSEEQLELKALLADKSEALELALSADDKAPIYFPRYRIKGVRWEYYRLGTLCEALSAKARLAAVQGDVPEALRCLRHISRISEGLYASGENRMIYGCGSRAMAVQVLRDMLNRLELSNEQLSLIADKLVAWEPQIMPDRQQWSKAKRSQPLDGAIEDDVEMLFRSMRRKDPLSFFTSQFISKRAILTKRLAVINECLSQPTWRAMHDAFRKENEAGRDYMYETFYAPTLGNTACKIEGLARMDLGHLEGETRWYLSQLAQIRLLRANVAILLYRRIKGKLPAVWGDLVPAYLPEPLIDPYSGKAFLLAERDDGLCIYSIGADGEDDGGTSIFSQTEFERASPEDGDEDETNADIGLVVRKMTGVLRPASSPEPQSP